MAAARLTRMPAREPGPWSRLPTLLVIGVTLGGLALRVPLFGESLWMDELSTNFVVYGFGREDLLGIVGSDQEGTPPLFFALAAVTRGLGDVEGLRLVSLLAGVLAIPLTYLLGRRTLGVVPAVTGAALMALSPFQIFFSTEARAYSLAMLLVLAAALVMLRALGRPNRAWWVALAVLTSASLWTHYVTALALAGLYAWALGFHRDRWKPILLAAAGGFALFLPWLPEYIEDGGQPAARLIEVAFPLTWETVRTFLGRWAVGNPLLSLDILPGDTALLLLAAGVVVGLVARLVPTRSQTQPDLGTTRGGAWLIAVLAIAAPAAAIAYSLVETSVFAPRNLIVSSPALMLLFAAAATAGRGWTRWLGAGLLLGGMALGTIKALDPNHRRPDYQGVAEFIQESGGPRAPVVDVPHPTPGPQTASEFALAERGEGVPGDRPVYVLGYPTFEDRLQKAGPGDPPILERIPRPTAQALAARAARDAGTGELFILAPADVSYEELSSPLLPTADFMKALPARFRPVEEREFPGVSIFPITVHVLRGDGGGAGAQAADDAG
jgi:hypothetical protein